MAVKNYKTRAERIRGRINPENYLFRKSFSDELSQISYSDILVYIRIAMKAVPQEYTAKSKEAGERVKEHLRKELFDVEYRYQGSVMTNTHIKGVSDIDLLVISNKFYYWDQAEVSEILNTSRKNNFLPNQIQKLEYETLVGTYTGNALDDLRRNRLTSETVLLKNYSVCDIFKPKAIKIRNLSLNREVDTVIANWFDNINSIIAGKGVSRGIQVYNKGTHSRGPLNFPFLSIERINNRSAKTEGRLKKMIRFLKNIKEDSNLEIPLSSFELNAICYDIPPNDYSHLKFYELVGVLYRQLKSIIENEEHANRLKSVDGTEFIFRNRRERVEFLRNLFSELGQIYRDLITEQN